MNRHFTKEDKQMENKLMKICSTSFAITECKLKPQWDIIMQLSEWLKWKIVTILLLQSKRSPVWYLARAHAWVTGSVPGPGACKRQLIDVSLSHRCFSPFLSPSLPPSLKINKILKKIKNSDNNQMLMRMWRNLILYICCWWECKMLQPVLKAVWQIIYILNMQRPYNPAVPLWDICLKEMKIYVYIEVCTWMFKDVLFVIGKSGNSLDILQ